MSVRFVLRFRFLKRAMPLQIMGQRCFAMLSLGHPANPCRAHANWLLSKYHFDLVSQGPVRYSWSGTWFSKVLLSRITSFGPSSLESQPCRASLTGWGSRSQEAPELLQPELLPRGLVTVSRPVELSFA